MEPNALAQAIEELILKADARYVTNITALQKDLYNQVLVILKDLELDDGYIMQTSANRRILNKADDKINEIFRSNLYIAAVTNYVSVVKKVDQQNIKYFDSIKESFQSNRVFLKNLQTDAIATVEKYILQDGLKAQVINPLSQILSQNVNTGGQFSGFIDQIKDFIVGNPDVEGRALRYTRVYLRDILFQYSRSYQESVTSDLGLDWYLYSGGIIDTSREFCVERAGKFFHRSEIEKWADLTWRGKIAGTTASSIFVFVGGHACSHSLIPVSKVIVPTEDLERIAA